MQNRFGKFVGGLLCAASISGIVCAAAPQAENDQVKAASSPVAGSNDGKSGEAKPGEATVNLSGKGRQASNKFTLGEGLAIVRVTNDGKSNFIVRLLNGEGDEVQGWFNQIGAYEAARGFEIRKAGEYLLDVQSDGAWSFAIEQPRPTTGESTPKALTGKRSDVTTFLSLKKGLSVFKYNYQGDGRFAAFLTDRNGRTVEQLVNTLKAADGSTPVKVPEEGVYFINVTADAPWQIDVQ